MTVTATSGPVDSEHVWGRDTDPLARVGDLIGRDFRVTPIKFGPHQSWAVELPLPDAIVGPLIFPPTDSSRRRPTVQVSGRVISMHWSLKGTRTRLDDALRLGVKLADERVERAEKCTWTRMNEHLPLPTSTTPTNEETTT